MRKENWSPIEFLEIPTNATVRESPAVSVSEDDKAAFNRTLRAAQRDFPTGNAQVIVYLGVDMGTSSTKVVARLPYAVNSPCIVIPAPRHCRSDDHPALWQTVLWRRGDSFSALPGGGGTPIRNLKQAALRAAADNAAANSPATWAAAAYLAYVIRHAKGWLLANRASVFANLTPNWIVQVGLPAKSFENTQLSMAYRRIALAASHLSDLSEETTKGIVSTALRAEGFDRAVESNDASLEQGVAVFPEIAAAATSFSKSSDRANGLYLIVDVGAMTLDVCTFFLGGEGGMDKYSVFAADVRPLGVEALHWFKGAGKDDKELASQVGWCLHKPVADTKNRAAFSEFQAGDDLPLFLVGGGAKSRFHEIQIDNLSKWMRRYYAHEGLRRLDIKFTSGVDAAAVTTSKGKPNGSAFRRLLSRFASPRERTRHTSEDAPDLNRLVVALGLSYPDDEIGQLVLPSDIPPLRPRPPSDYGDAFVSKDQV